MKITSRTDRDHDVTIVELEGKLTIGQGDVQLREEIKQVLDNGAKKILINLLGVKMMDSSGLGELVGVRSSAEKAGATVKLLLLEGKAQRALEMTRLIGIFETYDNENDALASFSGS